MSGHFERVWIPTCTLCSDPLCHVGCEQHEHTSDQQNETRGLHVYEDGDDPDEANENQLRQILQNGLLAVAFPFQGRVGSLSDTKCGVSPNVRYHKQTLLLQLRDAAIYRFSSGSTAFQKRAAKRIGMNDALAFLCTHPSSFSMYRNRNCGSQRGGNLDVATNPHEHRGQRMKSAWCFVHTGIVDQVSYVVSRYTVLPSNQYPQFGKHLKSVSGVAIL